MKTLLCIALLAHWQPNSPTQPTVLLLSFFNAVISQRFSDTELAEKYMCPSVTQRRDQAGDRVRYLFHLTIESYRKEFKEQGLDPKDVMITPFDEIADKPVKIIGSTDQVYEVRYKQKNLGYILLRDGKIASLNLVTKDGKASSFLSYCE